MTPLVVFRKKGYLVVNGAECETDEHVARVDVRRCPCDRWNGACPVRLAPDRARPATDQ